MASPAIRPDVMNCFDPFRRYPPSTFSARVRMAEASDPASVSVSANAPITLPEIRSGRKRACCPGVPSLTRPETIRLFWMLTMVHSAPSAAATSISDRA